METEQGKEYTEAQIEAIKNAEKKFDRILNMIGLQTPCDYIFLDFAIQKSRSALTFSENNLQFLFHTMSKEALLQSGRVFPHSIFLERIPVHVFDETLQTTVDTHELVMWVLSPSKEWSTRDILPFTDFHLYFGEVIKPLFNYSAEDLYRIFDNKKEDLYFITHGTRNDTDKKIIITLFVTKDNIIAFHFEHPNVMTVPADEKFKSKWISLEMPISMKEVTEFAIFERPRYQIVPSHHEESKGEKQVLNFSTPGLDCVDEMECVNCSS